MKIAAVSDDGKNISAHFGMARYYVVLTVEDGRVVNREMRDRSTQIHADHGEHADGEHHHHHHGHDHSAMAAAIDDCQVVFAGGMGRPAYASIQNHGIEPLLTDVASIDDAVQAYLEGRLQNMSQRMH